MAQYNRRVVLTWLIAIVAITPIARESVFAADIAAGATEYNVAMRDGVKLATNVFLPKGDGPFPTILARTPYSKDGAFFANSSRYTNAGYAYVVQDCRGRFRSEGDYRPFETDRDDGYDTVEWVAAQDWCNGKIGMTGASAMGITTLLAAIAKPDNLVAGFVVVAPESMWEEATFIGGVFKEADTSNWLKSQNAEDQIAERRAAVSGSPLEKETDIIQNRQNIEIPIFHLGGWYDIFCTGTQGNFTFLQNEGADGARGNQKLQMGPFGHGGLKGDLSYRGSGGLLSFLAQELKWFDYHLKGIDNGIMDEPAVKYYMMASARKGDISKKNGWQTAENWPPPSKATRLYLTGDGKLSKEPVAISSSSTTYRFDPANPVPTVGGANLTLPIGPLDQREVGERDDYLRFTTEPLEEGVVIAGPVTLELYASTDAPDTDFMAKLVDVYPDGYEALLLDAPIRTRYRDGRDPEKVKMMEPGVPVKLTFNLGSTANTFEKGHRIAVHVTSSNHPRFEVNPNTGEPPGENTKSPQVANNTIHHDREHPTAVVLPVVE